MRSVLPQTLLEPGFGFQLLRRKEPRTRRLLRNPKSPDVDSSRRSSVSIAQILLKNSDFSVDHN